MYCFLIRRMISRALDAGRTAPAFVEKHVSRCTDCCSYREKVSGLQEAMVSSKPADVDLPPFLHRRIMAGVKQQQNRPAVGQSLPSGRVLRFAAVAAVCLGAALLLRPGGSTVAPEPTLELLDALDSGRGRMAALVGQGPDRLVAPLRAELLLLEQDLTNTTQQLETLLDRDIFTMLATR